MALKNPFSRSSSRTSLNESMNQEEEDVIETLEDIGGNNDISYLVMLTIIIMNISSQQLTTLWDLSFLIFHKPLMVY